MADEFEQYRVNETPSDSSQDEFEQYRVQEPPQESLGASIGYAIPRVATDLIKSGYNAAQSIPSYFEKAKTEYPGFFNTLLTHPASLAGQGLAGANEAINTMAQLPLKMSQYGSDRLHLIPQGVTNAIQHITPEDTSNAINSVFGQPQYPGEAMFRGLLRNVPSLYGASRIGEAMPPLTKWGATQNLNKARTLANDRNIGQMNIDPNIVEDARQFLPNTTPYRNTLDAAQHGDYNSLFGLQSDLGKNAGGYANSLFSAAERSHGRAGLQTRNDLLNAIHENLQSQGHQDVSDLLRQGQNDYRRYMGFKPYRNMLIGAGITASIPHNPITYMLKKALSYNM